jgi:small multidrug resistance family-3 protein
MKNLINKVLKSTHNYNIFDFGCLKISLMSFGILLGAYFSKFFLTNIVLIWIIFIVSYLLIMYKTFLKK